MSAIEGVRKSSDPAASKMTHHGHHSDQHSLVGRLWKAGLDHSGLMLAARTTLPHFSVSAATCAPNSDGVCTIGAAPSSASCALIFGSARPALISRLSLSIIATEVPFGAPTPNHMPAS